MHKNIIVSAGLAISIALPVTLPAGDNPMVNVNETPAIQSPFAPVPIAQDKDGTDGKQPERPAPFTAEMSAEFMRKVMETSAKIEAIRKQMDERRTELFENHDQIKAYRAQMIKMQEQINAILAQDQELRAMEMERDILWSTMPEMPAARMRPGGGRPGMFPMMGK